MAHHQRVAHNHFLGYLEGKNTYHTHLYNWHRQGLKDDTSHINTLTSTFVKPGDYIYMFPTVRQALEVGLEGWDELAQMKKVDYHYPYPHIRTNEKYGHGIIKLVNGSRIIFGGVDDTRYRGLSLQGCVISEAASMDCRPVLGGTINAALTRTGGWKIIQSTPLGKNHFYQLYNQALEDPEHCFVSTINADDSGLVSPERLEQTRTDCIQAADGNQTEGEAYFQREMYCSFEVSGLGQIYSADLIKASTTRINYDSEHPLYVALDLGFRDATAAVFFQYIHGSWHIIDCYEDWNQTTEQYIADILAKAPVTPTAILPWDGNIKRDNATTTHADIYRNHGFRVIQLKAVPVLEGISAVRREFPMIKIDQISSDKLITALNNYNWRMNASKELPSKPEHSQYSHLCDALRYMVAAKDQVKGQQPDYTNIPPQYRRTAGRRQRGRSNRSIVDNWRPSL